jgi:hypothetical protein
MSTEVLAQFLKNSQEFIDLATSISPSDYGKVAKPGEWSAGYVIHHMADSDSQFAVRYLNILTVDQPGIVPFNEEVYAEAANYATRNPAVSLAKMIAAHAYLADLFASLKESDWSRTGNHPEAGIVTLTDVLNAAAEHIGGHANQLKEIINA